MKKIAVIFSILAANSIPIATGVYYFLFQLRSKNILEASRIFTDASVAYFNPFMVPSLLYYILASFFIGVSLLVAILIKERKFIDSFLKSKYFALFFIVNIVTPLILCFIKTWGVIIIEIAFFLIWLIVIKYSTTIEQYIKGYYKNNFLTHLMPSTVLIGISIFVLFLFYRLVFLTPNIMNAFFRIPEMYNIEKAYDDNKLNSVFKGQDPPSQYANTTTLINQFQITNGYEYIDIFNYPDWRTNSACVRTDEGNEQLSRFIDNYNHTIARPAPGSFWKPQKYSDFPALLHYSKDRLCIIPPVGSPEYIRASYASVWQALEELDLTTVKMPGGEDAPRHQWLSLSERAMRDSYLKHSALEWSLIANGRGQLRHHIYFLYPSYEYMMGKPLDETVIQYGVGYTLLLSTAGKIAQFCGMEPTYAGAIHFLSIFTYIAFAVFVFGISLIVQDIRLTSLATLLLLLNYIMRGFDVNVMVIGAHDLRVIFDIPAIYLLFKYCSTNKKYFLWWIFSVVSLALLNNFEFGLFLAASIVGTLTVYRLIEQKKTPPIAFFVASVAVVGLAYCVFSIPKGSMGAVFLLGFFSQQVKPYIVGILAAISAIYILIFIHMRSNKSEFSYPFLALTIYVQTSLCYYVWQGHSTHFYILLARICLPMFFYFTFLFKEKITSEILKNASYYTIISVSIVILVLSYKDYRSYEKKFNNTFSYHKMYAWTDHYTNINSTMNPAFFETAVNIIKKYIPDQKEIYMISQYDFLLTYLARKYSGMPHFDMSSNILSINDVEHLTNYIHEKKPEYLFIDSDINTPYELSIPYTIFGSQTYSEGRWHALSLNALQEIYERIESDYTRVEQGQLISVYRRIEGMGY